MKRRPGWRGLSRAAAVAALVALSQTAAPVTAVAAQPLVVVDVPSRHVERALKATVLLPDGFRPTRRYPVLYLLHGLGDNHAMWADPARGDARRRLRGFPGIVVMPDGGDGYYTDAYNGGRRRDPAWTRFYLEELVPFIERRFPIRRARRWRAIAGNSMGGTGAMLLAAHRPDLFGSAISFSGVLDHQRPQIVFTLSAAGTSYESIFGPPDGAYATGHNPIHLLPNLRHTRLLALTGDGRPSGRVETADPVLLAGGVPLEAEVKDENDAFAREAEAQRVSLDYRVAPGSHDWPHWREHLSEAGNWDLWQRPTVAPRRWHYRTVRQRGRMWGLRYRFSAAPSAVMTFRYARRKLSARGEGRVVIHGCGRRLRATLPFSHRCQA